MEAFEHDRSREKRKHIPSIKLIASRVEVDAMIRSVVLDDSLTARNTTVGIQGVPCNTLVTLNDNQIALSIHRNTTRSRESAKDRHEAPPGGYSHGITRLRRTRASIGGTSRQGRIARGRSSTTRKRRGILILRKNRAVAVRVGTSSVQGELAGQGVPVEVRSRVLGGQWLDGPMHSETEGSTSRVEVDSSCSARPGRAVLGWFPVSDADIRENGEASTWQRKTIR